MPLPRSCSGVGRLAVVGAVCRYGRDHAFCLPERGRHLRCIVGVTLGQHVRRDLARFGVDGQVQLALLPAHTAVPLSIPLASTISAAAACPPAVSKR